MTAVRFGYTPTHPGEVLKDEIEYRGISQRQLAEQMNFSYKALNDLLNGRRPITTSTAMMFEAALDVPATSLLQLQLKYNLYQAQQDQTLLGKLSQIRKFAAALQAKRRLSFLLERPKERGEKCRYHYGHQVHQDT